MRRQQAAEKPIAKRETHQRMSEMECERLSRRMKESRKMNVNKFIGGGEKNFYRTKQHRAHSHQQKCEMKSYTGKIISKYQ